MHPRPIVMALALAAAALMLPSALAQDVAVDVPSPDPVVPAVAAVGDLAPDAQVALAVDAPLAVEAGAAAEIGGLSVVADTQVGVEADAATGPAGPSAVHPDSTSFTSQAVDAAPVVAGSAAFLVLLGIAARALAAGALAGLPLFSRIERGAVLDNPVRLRIHELVAQDPGLSLSDIGARAGIAWGTAVHHLQRLQAHGLVVSARERGHRRFYVANTPAAAQRTALAMVMHPTAHRIAEFVAQRPGTDQTALCAALGVNNPSASKHLGRFEAGGLVLSQRAGRSRHYHATGGLHSALLLLGPAPGVA